MVNPAIQNDFSYYRRTLNRLKLSKQGKHIYLRFYFLLFHNYWNELLVIYLFAIVYLLRLLLFTNIHHIILYSTKWYFPPSFSNNAHSHTDTGVELRITGEVANRMSLFFAYPTPMMRVLIDATTKFTNSVSSNCPPSFSFLFFMEMLQTFVPPSHSHFFHAVFSTL